MSSLIHLNNEYQELLVSIKQNDGEISPELELLLTKNLIESKEKVSNFCLILDAHDNEIEFVKIKISEAKNYIEQLEKIQNRLKSIALQVVESRGSKLEGNFGRWINKRKSTSVNITDESKVPAYYLKIKTEIDKALIKADLNNGVVVDGADILTKESLAWK